MNDLAAPPIYYCKDCEFYDEDEALSAKHKELVVYCEKSRMRIWPYDKANLCGDEGFKPREDK